jgi:hypothetical protein
MLRQPWVSDCFFLMDRSGDPKPSHFGQQGVRFSPGFSPAPRGPPTLQRFHNQGAIGVFQGHRRRESSGAVQIGDHERGLLFVKWVG